MHYGPDGLGGWGVAMMAGMLLFWLILLGGLVLLIRYLARQGSPARPAETETPVAILDRRLAAGEISPDEYDALRRKIEGT